MGEAEKISQPQIPNKPVKNTLSKADSPSVLGQTFCLKCNGITFTNQSRDLTKKHTDDVLVGSTLPVQQLAVKRDSAMSQNSWTE